MDAHVTTLRMRLGNLVPDKVEVFAPKPGVGHALLMDYEPLPDKVFVPAFTNPIPPNMVLTKRQCQELQAELVTILRRPDMQQKFNAFELEADGNDVVYRQRLAFVLMDEVYPSLAPRYGLPEERSSMRIMTDAIGFHMQGDLDMCRTALTLETLMRNKMSIASNTIMLENLLKSFGNYNLAGFS